MQYLTFHIHDEEYAIAAADLVEVLPLMWIKRVPDAPAFLEGIINLRGALVPVLDLGKRLGDRPCTRTLKAKIVVVSLANRELGLIIEDVRDLAEVEVEQHRNGVLNQKKTPFINGILVDNDNKMVQVLVTEHILSTAELEELSEI